MIHSLTKDDVTKLDSAENVTFLATARTLALRAEEHIRERETRKIMEEKSKAQNNTQ